MRQRGAPDAGGHYLSHHQNKSSSEVGKKPQGHYLAHHGQNSSTTPGTKWQSPKLRDAVKATDASPVRSPSVRTSLAAKTPSMRTPSTPATPSIASPMTGRPPTSAAKTVERGASLSSVTRTPGDGVTPKPGSLPRRKSSVEPKDVPTSEEGVPQLPPLPESMFCRNVTLQSKYQIAPTAINGSNSVIQIVKVPTSRNEIYAAKGVSMLKSTGADGEPIRVRGMLPRTEAEVMKEALVMWLLRDVPACPDLAGVMIEPGEQRILLLMEYIKGESFREFLHHRGTLMEAEVQQIGSAIMKVFGVLHENGLAHYHFNLSHLMLKYKGDLSSVKLLDYSPPQKQDAGSSTTKVYQWYPPPETAVEKYADLDPKAGNMWAFGVLLLSLLPGCEESITLVAAFRSPPYLNSASPLCPKSKGSSATNKAWYATVQSWVDDELGRTLQTMRTHGVRKETCDLVEKCLKADPVARYTAKEALKHPWFSIKFLLPRR